MESQVKTRKDVAVSWTDAARYARLIASAHDVFYQTQTLTTNQPQNVVTNQEEKYNPSLQVYKDLFTSNPQDTCAYPNLLEDYNLLYNIVLTDGLILPGKVQGTATPAYYGFVAQYRQSPYNYVIVIRGTETQVEWNSDFQDQPTNYAEANNCQVVKGFYDLYETGQLLVPPGVQNGAVNQPLKLKDVAAQPSLALPDTKKYFTLITGHSLGGALAHLYASATANTSSGGCGELKVYTFAAPNVGDGNFALNFDFAVPDCCRIYNVQDKIPKLPVNLVNPLDPYYQVATGIEVNSANYPEIYHLTDTKDHKDQTTGCAHVLPTYLYMIEKKAGMNPDPSMLTAQGCKCRSSN